MTSFAPASTQRAIHMRRRNANLTPCCSSEASATFRTRKVWNGSRAMCCHESWNSDPTRVW